MKRLKQAITLDKATHTYYVNGSRKPGVTSIISDVFGDDYANVNKELMELSRDFGTASHDTISLYSRRCLDVSCLDEGLKPILHSWKMFVNDFGWEPLLIEEELYSEKYGFCGKVDQVGRFHKGKYAGKVGIVEIKTSSNISPKYAIQMDGYEILYNENIVRGEQKSQVRLVVKPLANSTYMLYDYTAPENVGIFLSTLNIRNWMKIYNIKSK